MNKQSVEEVAWRCGISTQVCIQRLNDGWTFIEGIDGVPRWEQPSTS